MSQQKGGGQRQQASDTKNHQIDRGQGTEFIEKEPTRHNGAQGPANLKGGQDEQRLISLDTRRVTPHPKRREGQLGATPSRYISLLSLPIEHSWATRHG